MSDAQPKPKNRGCLWRLLTTLGLFAVVIPVSMFLALKIWSALSQAAVNEQLATIRQDDRPATAGEVQRYYEAAVEAPDITAEWQAALVPLLSKEMRDDRSATVIAGFNDEDGTPFPMPGSTWPGESTAETFLKQNRQALSEIHRVAELDGDVCFFVDFKNSLEASTPHYESLRAAAWMLALEARVAARKGDEAQFAKSVLAILKTGHTLDDEPAILSFLIRISILGMAGDSLRDGSGYVTLTEQHSRALLDAFANGEYLRQLHRGLNGERACLTNYFLDMSRFDESGNRKLERYPFKYQDLQFFIQCMEESANAAKQTFPFAVRTAHRIDADREQMMEDEVQLTRVMSWLTLPACGAAFDAATRAQFIADSSATAVAIELYREKHGEAPADLDALVPDFLRAVPQDPYAGGPLRYVPIDDGFKLYSLGANEVDDGGTMEPDRFEPDLVLEWPRTIVEIK